MKTIRTILPLLFIFITTLGVRASVLFEDSSNYPYADGLIEGQGQWYCYSPKPPQGNTYVTNNVLYLVTSTTNDSVGAPTNGWVNPTEYNYASFRLNVSQLPATAYGGWFAQLQSLHDTNDSCHVFIQTQGTTVPGTYRLAVANYLTSYTYTPPPVTYSQDLSTGVWYTVVLLYDNDQANPTFVGSTLWINPSEQDYQNLVDAGGYYPSGVPGVGYGYVSGIDLAISTNQLYFQPIEIGFAPYTYAGISNVIAGTTFEDVNSTNRPVFGIQPQSGTNYTGNPLTFYAVASGVDLTYQWYSANNGQLSDNGSYIGSTSNTLIVANPSASDTYYTVVTDAYGNMLASSNAVETIITTLTAPFFSTNVVATTNYVNLFTAGGFTNTALGTGPLYYQWFFAPSNTPTSFSPLAGQTSPGLNLFLSDYTYAGYYYVTASNSLNSGSIAVGPTNELVEVAPLVATIPQLHNLMISVESQIAANRGGTITISTNVSVGGYVTTYGGFGSTYTEYYLQDASGYGIQIYLQTVSGYPSLQNTNTPPVGTYVTVTGTLEVYNGGLELAPTIIPGNPFPVTTNTSAPVIPVGPTLANSFFNDLVTNDLGTNALNYDCTLLTFTNVYFYYNRFGGFNGIANTNYLGLYHTNGTTFTYFTVGGPYSVATGNTNTMECYQFCYDYPEGTFGQLSPNSVTNPFYGNTVPIYCSQLTGVWLNYAVTNGGELVPSRLADYVTNVPPTFSARAMVSSKGPATLNWTPSVGSTYTVNSSTNLLGPWKQVASGLTYYPTNGAYTDTNKAPYKFYQITSP